MQKQNVKRHKEDDELDEEFKGGARKAYANVIEMIYERVEQLQSDFKQK